MNRPLVSVVLAYAAGLLLGKCFPAPPLGLLVISLVILVVALIFEKIRRPLLWLLLPLTGWVNLACHTEPISPHDLRRLTDGAPQLVSIRGILLETPTQRVYMQDDTESWRTLARVKVTAIKTGDSWQPAAGETISATPGTLPPVYFAGQTVEVYGILSSPPPPLAPGLLDYRLFLERQAIYRQLKAGSTNDWKLLSSRTNLPVSDRFLTWSQTTLSRGLPEVDEPLKLLWAMTLGWRPALTAEVSAPFMQSGTMHIFAISGLHIALIAGILVAILRTTQIPRFYCGFLIIPAIWFYTGATGWQPSAIRSTIMMTIVIGGWMLHRPGNLLNSLAAAAFVILLLDPLQLFQASFQLSFFVVLSIALLLPPLEKIRDRLLQTDPLLPRELLPRWQRWTFPSLRQVLNLLAVSLAAWLGSWPLCAYYFHIFSPVTLLANLLIVPLSGFALASNLGSLLCGAWFPWLSEIFNHSGWLWMKLMVEISHALTQLPHAYFYVRSPTFADFVIYYVSLLAVLTGVVFQKTLRWLVLISVLGIVAFYGWRWQETRRTCTLTVLPLNGGHAVFVQGSQRSGSLLVDCGDTNSVGFITQPFLRAQGVNRLTKMALTQGDVRDVGGALEVRNVFHVREIFTSPVRFRSATYRQILAELDKRPNLRHPVVAGDCIGEWRVLYPTATSNFSQADDNSLVLSGEINGLKVLLLSDLGRLGQEALLESTNDLTADIVVAGLPEKSQPLGDALLAEIHPRFIIIADSQSPATKRASAELRARLERFGVPVFYTRLTGAVTVVAKPGRWELSTMDGQCFDSTAASAPPKQTGPAE